MLLQASRCDRDLHRDELHEPRLTLVWTSDKDFRWIYYADSGVDLYSNGIMVSQKLAKEKPKP